MWSAPRSLALLAVLVALLAPATAGLAVAEAPSGTASVPGGATAPPDPGHAAPAALRAPAGQPRLSGPVNTTIRVDLHANASASWSIVSSYEIESDEERAAFEQYVEEYRTGETDAGPTADPFRTIVERASAATGREMHVENVTRTGTVGEDRGTVVLSFQWTDMLERTGDRTLRLNDAVLLPGNNTWLSTIEAGQRLVIATPPGYSIVDSTGPSFDIRDNAIVVDGPRTIERPLSVTYRGSATPTPDGAGQTPLVAGVVLLVAALVVGVYLWRGGAGPPTPVSENGGSEAGDAAAVDVGGDGSTPPRSADDTDTTGESGAAETADEPAPIDPDLLSDEERVERLLERNDGRMKQANIVSETGWSDAKVSQLLSSMADEGRVEKLRLGRENLISLPEEDAEDRD
jgi:hypothetical protein